LMILAAVVIIGREIAVSALREWMSEIGQRTKVAVSALGKYKTILQMVGLTLLLYRHDLLGMPIYRMGTWLTIVAAVLTLFSMLVYLRASIPYLIRKA
ncbi:MAG: CDP-alcohol phosphatidyltransferase family protein, partial [Steroidobacteraceae bacterium]